LVSVGRSRGFACSFGRFTELHSALYADILAGGGFGLADAKPSVELVYAIRAADVVKPSAAHPYLEAALKAKPAAANVTLPPPKG
jgi:hypothetical protein